MGRLTRAIRGFFGKFLSGVEQRNPEILLENAVQDELENLKKLQVAAARTMAYEKMLANDAASKQKTLAVKERQARELAGRGPRAAAAGGGQRRRERAEAPGRKGAPSPRARRARPARRRRRGRPAKARGADAARGDRGQ